MRLESIYLDRSKKSWSGYWPKFTFIPKGIAVAMVGTRRASFGASVFMANLNPEGNWFFCFFFPEELQLCSLSYFLIRLNLSKINPYHLYFLIWHRKMSFNKPKIQSILLSRSYLPKENHLWVSSAFCIKACYQTSHSVYDSYFKEGNWK